MSLFNHARGATRRALTFAALLAAAPACGPGGDDAVSGDGLRDVSVPAGFDFATTRQVALTVTTTGFTDRHARLEVARPDGGVLYAGPVATAAAAAFTLPLPTKDGALTVQLQADGVTLTQTVALTGGAVRAAFTR